MSGMDRIDVELDRREADELAELEELREREALRPLRPWLGRQRCSGKGGSSSGETGASLFAGCDTLEALRGWLDMGNRVWQCVHGRAR